MGIHVITDSKARAEWLEDALRYLPEPSSIDPRPAAQHTFPCGWSERDAIV